MSEITTILGTATTLFGAVTILAVLVTGFLLGRRWLNSTGFVDSRGRDSEDNSGAYRGN